MELIGNANLVLFVAVAGFLGLTAVGLAGLWKMARYFSLRSLYVIQNVDFLITKWL